MSAVTDGSLSEGQLEAIRALRSIARVSDGALTVDLDYEQLDGDLTVRVYLASASLLLPRQGTDLEDWEPIDIVVPESFPYRSPIAWAGRNLPELPHQARGSGFCVRVEDNDWDPAAGMPGFIRAVILAYQHIALGTLHGHLQAWRPMVHYLGTGCAVIKADLPAADRAGPGASVRWAVGTQVNDNRIDIVEWLYVGDDARAAAGFSDALAGKLARIEASTGAAFLVPAVVVTKPTALEYFEVWRDLLRVLLEQGVDVDTFLVDIARAATINQPGSGAGEGAVVLFRLAADTELATTDAVPAATGQDARFAVGRLTQDDVGLLLGLYAAKDGADDPDQMVQKFLAAAVPWVQVYDGRPESVLRRAGGGPATKLAGARVLLLGCGGLGAQIAEHCVRSGATRVHIVDSGRVSPGVLSRQPYEDADIGEFKAEVLSARLARIRPGNEVTASVADIVSADIFDESQLSRYDLVIDATANRSVAARIERSRRDRRDPWPTLITVAISQQATHGAAAVTPRGAVGAGVDLLRRLGLRTCMSTALGDVYAAFFPAQAAGRSFRPDPSCSDTTFIGSTTDTSALAAQLLDSALARLDPPSGANGAGQAGRSVSIVRLGSGDELKAARVVLDLPPDHVVVDHEHGYEVRIEQTAMEAMRDHARASVNGRAPGAGHTGGLLLGQFDSTCRIAWVSQATGLPEGSTATPLNMTLATDEVRDFLADRSGRSGGMLALIGFWHTHLGGSATPSETDRATMRDLVASPQWRAASALLLVLGVPAGDPGAAWVPEIHAETFAT